MLGEKKNIVHTKIRLFTSLLQGPCYLLFLCPSLYNNNAHLLFFSSHTMQAKAKARRREEAKPNLSTTKYNNQV